MDNDESGPIECPPLPDRPFRSRAYWGGMAVRAMVWFATTLWKMTGEGPKATLSRLGSHSAILFLALAAIAISGFNAPHVAGEWRQPAAAASDLLAEPDNSHTVFAAAIPAKASLKPRPALITANDMVVRQAAPLTQVPDRPREAIITYTVLAGDTLFGIALQFNLAPETILWANSELKDNPDMMDVGMTLNVPPVDGVVHVVQAEDTLESIAAQYKTTVEALVDAEWNSLRQGQQPIVGQHLIVPGGKREFVVWQLPVKPASSSGTASWSQGHAGFCSGVAVVPLGSGTFIWPEDNHRVGGNPYAAWHRAIDLTGNTGAPVYASDTGTVVYAGWNSWGYGNLIVLDHGNGWQTWYAHLSQIYVGCGQQLFQGAVIGAIGSTGRSTGPHLHFETRYNGDLPNPLNVLP